MTAFVPVCLKICGSKYLNAAQPRENWNYAEGVSNGRRGLVRCASEKSWLQRRRKRRSLERRSETKVAVCGGGSFGTAIAFLLANNGYPVQILVRKTWVRDEINVERRNPKYFTEFVLPDNVTATIDAEEALTDAKLIVHAVPVQQSRSFFEANTEYFPADAPVLCTSKGLEVTSLKFMCELLPEFVRDHGSRIQVDLTLIALNFRSFAGITLALAPTHQIVCVPIRAELCQGDDGSATHRCGRRGR
mmetsp:Transcript_34312/g.134565  ORF Transcript_34312/g.134565 Transcript_34312/m.134565 type:complete len:247 (-) Transcript_34312:2892-3632(-)